MQPPHLKSVKSLRETRNASRTFALSRRCGAGWKLFMTQPAKWWRECVIFLHFDLTSQWRDQRGQTESAIGKENIRLPFRWIWAANIPERAPMHYCFEQNRKWNERWKRRCTTVAINPIKLQRGPHAFTHPSPSKRSFNAPLIETILISTDCFVSFNCPKKRTTQKCSKDRQIHDHTAETGWNRNRAHVR